MTTADRSAHGADRPGGDEPGRRRVALHWKILIGLVVGGVAGIVAHMLYPPQSDGTPHAGLAWVVKNIAEPIGQIFLRLIFMVVLPLVFSALVLGVAGMGNPRRLGRVGLRTLGFTVVLSVLSVVLGVGLVNVVRPGAHLSEEQRTALRAKYETEAAAKVTQVKATKSVRDTLLDIIPRNPLQEMVGATDGSSPGGGMLAVMFFALIFGAAVTVAPERTAPLIGVLEGVFDIVLTIVGWAMRIAPLGVAGLTFSLTATLGFDIIRTLLWYVFTVLGGLSFHLLVVYSLTLILFARTRPLRFFSAASDALVTAFATSSSNATLPTALRVAEKDLGIHREISGFVLTVGATANQNGTALYEGVTVLFLAQVFGVDLTLSQQLIVALMAVLGGIGTAGIPSGSIPIVVMILLSVNVPGEAIGIILGVDRVLDMCRTVLNVAGDLVVAACVDRSEGGERPAPA
jgi:DAACS family dicarboxylate/amino acid:cation (Na+ or H+) symporter